MKCNQDSFILMSCAKTKNYNLGKQKKANNTTVLNFEIIGLTLEPQKWNMEFNIVSAPT